MRGLGAGLAARGKVMTDKLAEKRKLDWQAEQNMLASEREERLQARREASAMALQKSQQEFTMERDAILNAYERIATKEDRTADEEAWMRRIEKEYDLKAGLLQREAGIETEALKERATFATDEAVRLQAEKLQQTFRDIDTLGLPEEEARGYKIAATVGPQVYSAMATLKVKAGKVKLAEGALKQAADILADDEVFVNADPKMKAGMQREVATVLSGLAGQEGVSMSMVTSLLKGLQDGTIDEAEFTTRAAKMPPAMREVGQSIIDFRKGQRRERMEGIEVPETKGVGMLGRPTVERKPVAGVPTGRGFWSTMMNWATDPAAAARERYRFQAAQREVEAFPQRF